MTRSQIAVSLHQVKDFQFDIRFGAGIPSVIGDEPPPLGKGLGPSPVQLLTASVGNCLSDSLLFALRKYRQQPEPIACDMHATVGRNAQGRLRVLGMHAALTLGTTADRLQHLDRALSQFEAYCTVTQSVGTAFPVTVTVRDAAGQILKGDAEAPVEASDAEEQTA